MLLIKRLPLLISLTLLINTSTDAQLYPTKIINMPDGLIFKYNHREPGSTLIHKGEDEDNNDLFILVSSNNTVQHLIVPKEITKENPIRFCDPKAETTILLETLKTHNNTIEAHDANLIKEFQDTIAPEKVIDLPEATIENSQLHENANQTLQNLPDSTCSFDANDTNYYDTPIETQTAPAPKNNSWMPYIIGGSTVTFFLLGYYYLLSNASRYARYLSRQDIWSSWKSEESYETLLQVKPKYLASDLIEDIRTTYYQKPNPIELFLRAIQEEYDTLLKCMHLRNTVYRFYLPLGDEFAMIENRLALLNRMRKAIHYWRAQEIEQKSQLN